MSKTYDNNLSGALFKNDKEGGNPNWPDYKGQCEIHGQQFWISAWIKPKKDGSGKFMSLSFKAKDEKPKAEHAPAEQPALDDDIPF